jgi:nucleoside-diphosphate-sugar epimerase
VRVLVTGATGLVGREVIRRLSGDPDWRIRQAIRRPETSAIMPVETVTVGDLAADIDWSLALQDVDAVVHAAARVHMMRDRSTDPLSEFRRVNASGTVALAKQAAAAGVRRFVFLSSIKVMGEQTTPDRPFRADDSVAPSDPYGISKYEAEQGLRALARETGVEVVVIRPVLIYGPGVRANFESMMRAVLRGLPLPLGAIHNRRSLVAVQNLCSLIESCLRHPAAANQTFLVSDGEDLSTTELLRRLARAMRRPSRLVPIPETWLLRASRLVGWESSARRLLGSLQVDIDKTRRLLQWSPELSVDDGLAIAAEHFCRNASG